jgi:hypothetical protein
MRKESPRESILILRPVSGLSRQFTVRSNAAVRGKYGVYTDGAMGARYYF